MKAMMKQIVAASSGIISTPNQPMYGGCLLMSPSYNTFPQASPRGAVLLLSLF